MAIFRLAYHHGLRASEIGRIQMEHWRPGISPDMDRLFLPRLKGSRQAGSLQARRFPAPLFSIGRALGFAKVRRTYSIGFLR